MSCFFKDSEKADKTAFLMKNGENFLEKLITSCNGKYNPIRSYSAEELKEATNNYDIQNVITSDASYELYKGFLQGRSISVMKFNDTPNSSEAYEYCYNNIVFASKMSHKNILRLIGCCLETRIPILVFEPVEYGTLADRTYNNDPWQPCFVPLLLTQRLKIAMEIANALAYFHVGFSRPIVFRTINPINILFDEQNVAKLSDFTLSESIPEGETHIKGWVAGTMGLIAPDYMRTGLCNEQSDVYSFGVLLLVLLTGQRIYDPSRGETGGDYWLLLHVKKCNENNRFIEMIDPVIVRQVLSARKVQQLQAFTNLALKCASESPNDRPTMVDVAKQLRQLYLNHEPI
ncbi:hypothetical protein Ddye_028178 [Dipteronia dyeriana]|uniref:Protein kinase domain-containing protein n=1 Tax=Dipteronia dyeriana TaxID=168575 RepID=A0AAD9WS42_9ROSI|nr:hypothetical protein Ddye_028178 [Dipteronia dyeriana]